MFYIKVNGKTYPIDSPVELAIARRALTTAGIPRSTVWLMRYETPMSVTADRPLPTKPSPNLRLIQGGKQ
jgi:hypothetical protein